MPDDIGRKGHRRENGNRLPAGTMDESGRIELEAGGAGRMAMPAFDAGAIDKVPDARANEMSP